MLEPNVHNGDCINVDDTDYLVQALSIRFKLVRFQDNYCGCSDRPLQRAIYTPHITY